jgi:hypothetical protein
VRQFERQTGTSIQLSAERCVALLKAADINPRVAPERAELVLALVRIVSVWDRRSTAPWMITEDRPLRAPDDDGDAPEPAHAADSVKRAAEHLRNFIAEVSGHPNGERGISWSDPGRALIRKVNIDDVGRIFLHDGEPEVFAGAGILRRLERHGIDPATWARFLEDAGRIAKALVAVEREQQGALRRANENGEASSGHRQPLTAANARKTALMFASIFDAAHNVARERVRAAARRRFVGEALAVVGKAIGDKQLSRYLEVLDDQRLWAISDDGTKEVPCPLPDDERWVTWMAMLREPIVPGNDWIQRLRTPPVSDVADRLRGDVLSLLRRHDGALDIAPPK